MKLGYKLRVIVFTFLIVMLSACESTSNSGDNQESTFLVFENNQSADIVIGQDTMDGDENGSTTNRFSGYLYGSPYVYNGQLFIPDYDGNRVLVYDSIPTENNASADYVIGQIDLNSTALEPEKDKISGPQTVIVSDGKLFITDYNNNRILIYNTIPQVHNASADVVVGQADFNTSNTSCSAYGLSGPESISVADGKLIISDSDNNRVLIYNTIPTENNASADIVLGEDSFTTCASNDDDQNGTSDANPTARTLDYPAGVWSNGEKLVVSDSENNRVLIWDYFPTDSFTPADVVLGQSQFDMNQTNDDNQDGIAETHPTSRTFSGLYDGIASNGTQLFVADYESDRVLIWNSFPTANFTAADVILGQPTEDVISCVDPVANRFCGPNGLFLSDDKLIVMDGSNHRALIFTAK